MIECRNIGYQVGPHSLLDGVDFDIQPGELVTLLGPNGAGKSTLLRVLSGELAPTSGTVTLNDANLADIAPNALARRRAVVPQSSQLSFAFTALEVVLLGITVPGFSRNESDQEMKFALQMLEQVGLPHLARRFYPTLSGGEKQRVQLARALCQLSYRESRCQGSQFLLLDEAMANLDIAHQILVCRVLQTQLTCGRSVVLVAHDLDLAAAVSQRVALMKNGRIIAYGPVNEIFQSELLSEIYDCELLVDRTRDGPPTVRIIENMASPH